MSLKCNFRHAFFIKLEENKVQQNIFNSFEAYDENIETAAFWPPKAFPKDVVKKIL